MPLGIDATIQYGVGSWRALTARTCASRAATTRARTAGCRRRRSATPAWPRWTPPRTRRRCTTSTTSRSPAIPSAGTTSRARYADFQHFQADAPGLTDRRRATRVACVIGDPVEHSRSPLMHNAASAALGLDRVYVALRVAPADLARRVRGLAALGFDGANVTLPHKAAARPLCDELGPEARDAGAVNTLSFAARQGAARRPHRRARPARRARRGARGSR